MQINQSLSRVSFAIPIALVALLLASPTGAQTNYPVQAVTPNYVEADDYVLPFSAQADDHVLPITLPFPFTFYGVPYTEAWVSTNGYINFLKPNSHYNNSCPIQRDDLNAAIYAFWDDLYVDGAASVRTRLLGEAPSRKFVIEWRNVRVYDNWNWPGRLNFEIVLHETGAIVLQYKNVASDGRARGESATIGVESQTGEFASQWSCNTASLGPGDFAIRFGQEDPIVAVDIKPGGCPNPFNVGSKGVLPVAILGTAGVNGTAGFDVTQIDPMSVKLAGVEPLRWSYEDVGTPYEPFTGKNDPYDCTALGPDGNPDMTFKFDSEDITVALGAVTDGEPRVLTLSGKLRDGTPITGEDVVTIIKKGK